MPSHLWFLTIPSFSWLPTTPSFSRFRRAIKFPFLRNPRVQYCVVTAVLLAFCAVSGYIPYRMLVGSAAFHAPNGPLLAEIRFELEIVSVDPIARTFVIDWHVKAPPCNYTLSNSSLVANIYLDPVFLDQSSPSFSNTPPYMPAYQYSNDASCITGTQFIRSQFRTISTLSGLPLEQSSSANIRKYPFDEYVAQAVLHAVDNETGASVPVNITQSFGLVANFDVSLWSSSSVTWATGFQILYIALQVKRSITTKLFVISIAVINWLIAATFVLICASNFIYPQSEIYSEMFIAPVGAVFALTSVRANLPGSPSGFGADLDTYTILPVVIILGICSVILPLRVLWRRVRAFPGNNGTDISPTQQLHGAEKSTLEKMSSQPSEARVVTGPSLPSGP